MPTTEYPEFRMPLRSGGPVACGRLLDDMGTNGSHKFLVIAGAPVRPELADSFPKRAASSHRLRQRLIDEGTIVPSRRWPGDHLETSEDIVFNSSTAAAEVLLGRPANGWDRWRTEDGRYLRDFIEQEGWGRPRTWLVRGSNVSGFDLVTRLWLPEGQISLAGTHLRPNLPAKMSKEQLRAVVEEDYESASTYGQRTQLVDAIYAFLYQMKAGDTVCTISEGQLYVGTVAARASRVESADGRSNLRRHVEWQSGGFAYEDLPEELQQRLSIQHDVVDLTQVGALVAGLGRSDAELIEEAGDTSGDPSIELAVLAARRELELPEPTQDLAADLLVHDVAWLREVRGLLWDERQVVLYGPPGTGKTYLALKLAEFLAGAPERVTLVQFHPSYSYEDFFEGFRPVEDPNTGQVVFGRKDGPLRELADLATREGNRHIPHFLVIDEINRANLAKVFGELYFLLEYRNRAVRLTYSGDDFALPPNLFIIGTMNTMDRSIASLDSAMRRRFAFVELSPRTEPTSGLLRRWLASNGYDTEPAVLLEALNTRIADPDFRIGPSYLMKKGVYREGGLERTWRTKILPLLEEYHYGEGIDVEQRYGLAALRGSQA